MLWYITCYFPAEESPLLFGVGIESDACIAEVLDEIYLRLESRCPWLDGDDLRLYKADVPLDPPGDAMKSRVLEWLRENQSEHLSDRADLTTVFPNGPHPRRVRDRQLDIIVADAEILEVVDDLRNPDHANQRKIRKSLEKHLICLNLNTDSPSEIVQSSHKQAILLGGEMPLIFLGRPGGVPATIFSPALAALQERLDHLEQVNVLSSEVMRAAKYLKRVVDFHKDEDRLRNAVQDLVDDAIGERGEWDDALDWADNTKPSGSWWHHDFLFLVLEIKNSLGLSGDALLQAVFDYSKVVSQFKFKPFREFCNFPIVLLGATANRLEVSVAVCVGPIYVTKLLSLDLSFGFHASDNIVRLARVFNALSCCRADLKKYYNVVEKLESPRLACLFPNPTTVNSTKPSPKLTYQRLMYISRAASGQPISDLDLGKATTAMYLATLDDTNEEVIVKFTAHYNEEAHTLLDAAGLAPKLHFCGRVIGGLYMVVMEHVDGASVRQLHRSDTKIPAIVSEKVHEAVRILHHQDIVHGNLQNPNIIYNASRDRVVVVDFDRAAKDGEGRYPATLNSAATLSPNVWPHGIMHKEHDLWQLDRLANLCKLDADA